MPLWTCRKYDRGGGYNNMFKYPQELRDVMRYEMTHPNRCTKCLHLKTKTYTDSDGKVKVDGYLCKKDHDLYAAFCWDKCNRFLAASTFGDNEDVCLSAPVLVNSWDEFQCVFGSPIKPEENVGTYREPDTSKRCGTCRYRSDGVQDIMWSAGISIFYLCMYHKYRVPNDYWCWRWLAPKEEDDYDDSVIGHEW